MFFPVKLTIASYLAGSFALALPHPGIAQRAKSSLNAQKGGFELPITRHVPSRHLRKRGDLSGTIGLGNNADLLYTVPIEMNGTVVAVNLDTGSSDLWVITDRCKTNACATANAATIPSTSVIPAGADVEMFYGDSSTGTFASGSIGRATATIAGIAMEDQAYGAINDTSNFLVQFRTSGIFGLGFPSGSKIQETLATTKSGPVVDTDNFVEATYDDGPLLSRISMADALELPVFSISLSRDTVDVSGHGMLTVGRLPNGVDESALTWVPIRRYDVAEGGLHAPNFAPDEVYPFRWEIDIQGVFLDGKPIPNSRIAATGGINSTRTSAIVDTGNSLLRGPQDMVDNILGQVSATYNPAAAQPVAQLPCVIPRTLAFQIGGKMFPVDPRDFISPLRDDDANTCVADNLVGTDAPSVGATFRWSLGDPFLRSNLVAFHYGNLTHPSVDPPRIGLLSLVPDNAAQLLADAVREAQLNGGHFAETLQVAPTASAAAEDQVTISAADEPIFTISGSFTTPAPPVPRPTSGSSGPNDGAGDNGGINANADSPDQDRNGSATLSLSIVSSLGSFLVFLCALMVL